MSKKYQWTNASVLGFAAGDDPVATMEGRAREVALEAIDGGWGGPPFDPLQLAQRLGMNLEARGDIADARLVQRDDGQTVLEYNPTRPRGRLRFSIAHEIAHSLFADWSDRVRHRGGDVAAARDNWQLEVMCNIGAAELLMPSGSFTQLANQQLTIDHVMEARKTYDVSVEACLIRLIKLARTPCAAFCASAHEDDQYRIDYVIPALGWDCPVHVGQVVPQTSLLSEVTAIGFTAVGEEEWISGKPMRLECVGLAPYPGALRPRVVGILVAAAGTAYQAPEVKELVGNALDPHGTGPRLIAHVVPDSTAMWGGAGFASALRKKFPAAWTDYKIKTATKAQHPKLGDVFVGAIGNDLNVAHMVAQHGIGPSGGQRLRYAALAHCLTKVREEAQRLGATVHMPRVGTGHGGASWDIVRELIAEELVDKGVATTVYRLPA